MIENYNDQMMAEYGAVEVVSELVEGVAGARTEVQTERLRDLLRTVTERIPTTVDDNLKVFDKSNWKNTWEQDGQCGTRACVLGWHIELSEMARRDGFGFAYNCTLGDEDLFVPQKGGDTYYAPLVMDYFGLDENEAEDIFINQDYGPSEVAELIKELLDE